MLKFDRVRAHELAMGRILRVGLTLTLSALLCYAQAPERTDGSKRVYLRCGETRSRLCTDHTETWATFRLRALSRGLWDKWAMPHLWKLGTRTDIVNAWGKVVSSVSELRPGEYLNCKEPVPNQPDTQAALHERVLDGQLFQRSDLPRTTRQLQAALTLAPHSAALYGSLAEVCANNLNCSHGLLARHSNSKVGTERR